VVVVPPEDGVMDAVDFIILAIERTAVCSGVSLIGFFVFLIAGRFTLKRNLKRLDRAAVVASVTCLVISMMSLAGLVVLFFLGIGAATGSKTIP
jgi:hypothetical protein